MTGQPILYLATASTKPVRDAMAQGLLGQLRTPDVGHVLVPGAIWAADNGCFNAKTFTVEKWRTWLDKQPRTPLWAAVPDVLCDHRATVARWAEHADWVHEHGFRAAFVAQNGCPPHGVPDDADAVFIGGDTEWKLSIAAHRICQAGKDRGLMVHMGRVNTLRRLRIAADFGCDSVDGTLLTFGPDKNLPALIRWLHPAQRGLFGGVG